MSPKIMPLASDAMVPKATIRMLSAASSILGIPAGAKYKSKSVETAANARPPTAPSPASTKVSVNSCCAIRPRLAPSAPRKANSRLRSIPAPNRMAATLPHANASKLYHNKITCE